MTIAVDLGGKATKQTKKQIINEILLFCNHVFGVKTPTLPNVCDVAMSIIS